MAISGERFVGTWMILKWHKDLPSLPEWLVQESKDGAPSGLTITRHGRTYSLQWRDTDGDLCTVTSLKHLQGTLLGGSVITIQSQGNKKSIPLRRGAQAGFGAAAQEGKLIVSLVGGIVEGEAGTITLEAHPRGDDGRSEEV